MTPEYRKALEDELATIEARHDAIFKQLNEVEFGSLRKDGEDGAVMSVYPQNNMATMALAESFAETLGTAENYMSIRIHHATVGWMEVVIQRANKVTPAEGRRLAEAEVTRLLAVLAAHGIAEESRIKLIPVTMTEEEASLARRPGGPDWIVIDFNKQPNDMYCQRCGTRHVMPDRWTADMLSALQGVFEKAHRGCVVVAPVA